MQATDQPKRIVVKFGTGILTERDGVELDIAQLAGLSRQVALLKRAGHDVVVVSSGAVGAGLMAFQLDERPEDLADLQACAAVGQTKLMHTYKGFFQEYGLLVAQLLLIHADFQEVQRRANFQRTLLRLLAMKSIVPIINENDTVATEELTFGDNDALSVDVSILMQADLLLLLTSVDGLMPPGSTEILDEVEDVGGVMHYATIEKGKLSKGGMGSKLRAVKRAVENGVETVIANGRKPENISDLVNGNGRGTRFLAESRDLS